MPSLVINTNIPKASISENFLVEVSALVAELMGKPESYVSIHVNPDQMMTWGGTNDPCALCYLGCIGKLGLEENKGHTAKLTEKINKDLKIPVNRMYIHFTDLQRQDVGWNGKTFAA